jgi:hypothetical protein
MPKTYNHELKVTVMSTSKKKDTAFEQVFDALQLVSGNYGRNWSARVEHAPQTLEVVVIVVKGLLETTPRIFENHEQAQAAVDGLAHKWGFEDYAHYCRCLHEEETRPDEAADPRDYEIHWFPGVSKEADSHG